jgi:hypothetical protein
MADLERAREALAAARARQDDPWRVTELQLRHDRLQAAALDGGPYEPDDDGPPPPRGPVPYPPLPRGERR